MIFGNLGNVGEMMKMAKEMSGRLKAIKEELAREIFEGNAGGVNVKVNGEMEIIDINIDQRLVNPHEVEKLQKLIKEAAEKALKLAKEEAGRKMKGLTGGLGLPSIPGLF
jgi:DNA-binding YbaB/EbfC family protein